MPEAAPYPPVPADLARLIFHLVRKSRPYIVCSGDTAGYIVPRREFERLRTRARLMTVPAETTRPDGEEAPRA
jgi:hypothetical protein